MIINRTTLFKMVIGLVIKFEIPQVAVILTVTSVSRLSDSNLGVTFVGMSPIMWLFGATYLRLLLITLKINNIWGIPIICLICIVILSV